MPRIRKAIFVVCAVILLAAAQQPKNDQAPQDADTSANVGDVTNFDPPTPTELPKPSEKYLGCQNGHEDRKSDLCAQWKAADAASYAAEYAFWTLLLSAVGTGFLVWTFYETRKTARREARAYIRIEAADGGVVQAGKPISIPFQVHNYGLTPAMNFAFESSVVVRSPGWDWANDPDSQRNDDPRPRPNVTIHPNSPVIVAMEMAEALPQQTHAAILNGQAVVFGRGTAHYRDVFGRRRFTTIQVEFHGSDAGPNGLGGHLRIAAKGNDFS